MKVSLTNHAQERIEERLQARFAAEGKNPLGIKNIHNWAEWQLSEAIKHYALLLPSPGKECSLTYHQIEWSGVISHCGRFFIVKTVYVPGEIDQRRLACRSKFSRTERNRMRRSRRRGSKAEYNLNLSSKAD